MTTVAPAPGELIGDYEILERIGGNMGLVFKARHRLLNKVVALKLVPANRIADPAQQARFQREIRIMGQLEHANLVTAGDARSVDNWHLVAMELIDGVDLHQLVRAQGPLRIAAACEVARQAALGLQFAHEHALIHRDIKPSNLMLTRAGIVKVIDLGLALVREDSTVQVTQTGQMLGTLSYCAPEQFRDASHVDIRADIYSLGCTLYHLITGKAPYSPRKTFAEIVQAHLHEPFPKLTEARSDAPKELEAVLARMTAKDREARYPTPAEVVAALEPFARGAELGPLVPAATQKVRGDGRERKLAPTPEYQRVASDEQSRARWPRTVAILALLLAVGVAVLLAVNPWRSREQVSSAAASPARLPVVVPVDTIAPGGIYDEEDRRKGISNTDALKNSVLRDLPLRVVPLNISIDAFDRTWSGENDALAEQPDLVVIHRSSFFHPLNAVLEVGSPPFANFFDDINKWHAASNKWQTAYRVADDKLLHFIAIIGNASPRTKFLVYSTGTDANWTKEEHRKLWKEQVELRFPALKGRIDVMYITRNSDGTRRSFKEKSLAEDMRHEVKRILRIPD